ncbi:hypothetical protein M501DRAFT_995677 [Patellaria atrata CBS 101060]|uniref:CorA-like transporter domain-containing protein n=1 Tax=Patellaria atrata CBS 101060 TaxID=1346257 RepID=A0A9P4S713_9PEZI|nr:hypothetical protein M501DRAFT_995677 [Patellaria atrata CBS 101060]
MNVNLQYQVHSSDILTPVGNLSFDDDAKEYLDRIQKRSHVLFNGKTNFDVRLTRIRCKSTEIIHRSGIAESESVEEISFDRPSLSFIKDEYELDEHLKKSSEDLYRVISFSQEFSLDPLSCTKEAMMVTIRDCRVPLMFFDVLLKFGNQEQVFDESSGFRQACQRSESSFEISYQLMYVEPNGRRLGRDPWSYRQTGLYHRYQAKGSTNIFVLLHPKSDSVVQQRIESCSRSPEEKQSLAEHPMYLHLIILKSYTAHWQSYIEDLADGLAKIRSRILVLNVRESHFQPEKLQTLRNLEDKISCKALRCLRSTVKLVQTLKELNVGLEGNKDLEFEEKTKQVHQAFRLIIHRLEGHINAAEMLAERIQSTIGLFRDLLDLQNQAASDKLDNHMLKLTRESVDDNATVRVITFVTLIYLPASFMAVSFKLYFLLIYF